MAQKTVTGQEYRTVGKPTARIEGVAKVTGKTVYADDMKLPRMLHAKILGSPHAHARIKSIDATRARNHAGVAAVITAAELPPYRKSLSERRRIILAAEETLFHGQPVAAVLAEDPHTAEEALELIQVEYEELPAVLDPVAAMGEDSPLARSPVGEVERAEERGRIATDVEREEAKGKPSNIASQMSFKRGDVEQGFADGDVVIEGTWRTHMVHQSYIEPHATIADYDASGELAIWSSTQGPFFIRDQVSKALGIPESRIRVTAMEVGGGFGGKIYLTELMVAALAMAVRRPVKYVMSRKEDMLAATPAPQTVVELKTGMKRDGTLTALKARLIYDSGAFPGAPVLPGSLFIGGYYKCPNLDIQGVEVLTNKVSVGALRAPGVHNATFAIESHMDMMAEELGLDPLEVRLRNAVGEGDPLPSGQPYPRIGLRECLEAVGKSDIWRERAATRKAPNRGVGLAIGAFMGGLQPASALVGLNSDGTINVTVGCADITGVNTSFAQIAAEVLNVPLSMVAVTTGDTKTAPYAGMSAGSKTTYTVGRAVKEAAEDARRQIVEIARRRLDCPADDVELADGEARVKGSPGKSLTFRRLGKLSTDFEARYPAVVGRGTIAARRWAPGFSAQAVEVEVDPDTGQVTILRCVIAQDAGFAINPLSVSGQMQGGASQGLGIGLSEEMIHDDEGHLISANLLDYRLLTTGDLPPIETIIVEVPSEEGPYGARIVGEPSIVPGAAALANAIADAVGVRLHEVPATPERTLKALRNI